MWQIGRFDASSGEFNSGVDPVTGEQTIDHTDPSQDPVFVPGKSDPSKQWYAFQPGTRNRDAGLRPHPFTVEFFLPDVPRGLYTLTVAVLVEHPSVSRLNIEVNGHAGRFHFHPKLNYAMGDMANSNFPEYSSGTVTIEIPSQLLKKGNNRFVLTAVDEDDPHGVRVESSEGLNSGLVYDALSLEHDPSHEFEEAKIEVLANPTVFYKMLEGRLHELVDVFVRVNQPVSAGELTLALGEWKSAQKFESDRAFGEYHLEFSVPEFTYPARGEVSVEANGLSKHVPLALTPARKWNLFVVPHIHLDIGFTDYQSKIVEVHCRAIDKTLDILEKRPEFRLSLDGEWIVEQFLLTRSEEQRQRFAAAVRENQIGLPAQYVNLLTGMPTLETLVRSLYAGKAFHSQLGGTFDYANITDVPSYTWSYPSVLAAAGLKYFIAAANNHDAPVLLLGRLHEKSPFWWEGPDGGRILMWYSRHYDQAVGLFGRPFRVESGRDSLPLFLQIYDRPEYKPDAAIILGTEGDNQDLIPEQAEYVENWNAVYAYPKLHFSGFSQAMQYIAQQAGDAIPTFRGDGAPYWEEGAPSDAYYVALNRQNEARALSAEKAATISNLVDPHVKPDEAALKSVWENLMMFDEHTWTDALSVGDPESRQTVAQLAVKDSRPIQAQSQLERVLGKSLEAIANRLPFPPGTLMVFNFLSWGRSGLVEMDLRDGLELHDLATNQVVPYEIVGTTRTYKKIRFLASDVPAMGYKCYRLSRDQNSPRMAGIPPTGWDPWQGPGHGGQTGSRAAGQGAILENGYYKVVLDPASGAVKSIFDKELDKELVDGNSPFRFDQYVYVTGADKVPNRLIRFPNAAPPPHLEANGATGDGTLSVSKTPFGEVARLTSSGVNTPRITTEIVLFDQRKKIQFTNRVNKTKVYTREAVYFAFPFAMDHPRFLYEIQNGFVDPAENQLPGAGKEWFSVQQWVAVEQGGVAAAIVPVHVPLVALGDFVHGTWAQSFGTRQGTIFSFVMNNYWEDNYVAGQGGDFTFRYVMTSGATLPPSDLSQLGWEESTPLELNTIVSQDKATSPPSSPSSSTTGSFVEVNPLSVLLIAWKLAEDGHGTIVRFLEAAGRAETVTVRIPLLQIQSAWKCNAVEQNEQSLQASGHEITFSVRPFEIATLRIEGGNDNEPKRTGFSRFQAPGARPGAC